MKQQDIGTQFMLVFFTVLILALIWLALTVCHKKRHPFMWSTRDKLHSLPAGG